MKIQDLNKQLWDGLDSWKTLWRPIHELMLPYRSRLEDQENQNWGKEKADLRFDGTATRSLRILSAGMHGGLTNPSAKWFRLGLEDLNLSKVSAVRRWLDDVENILYAQLRKSNFYQAVQNNYLEAAGFGTTALFSEAHSSGVGVWFRVITTGDFAIATDYQGRVNTLFRRDWLTLQQIVDRFGEDKLQESQKTLYENQPYHMIKVIHGVLPRTGHDVTKVDIKNMPFQSVYFDPGAPESQPFLGEGGFKSFPYHVPRWDVVGNNAYGYSPGMDALPDVRSINGITADLLTAVEKEVNPPVNVPAEFEDGLDLMPGGRNTSTNNAKVTATYQISPNLSAGSELKREFKNDIGEWFYTPLFILLANPNATATEIAKKNEEQLIQMGPVIQRMFIELLNPAIGRTFSICNGQGLIPPAPPEAQQQGINIEYIGTLAQAQKLVGVQKLERFVGFVGGVAEIFPQAPDNVDIDKLIQEHADGTGVPNGVLNSDKVILQIREARAQRAAEQAQQERAMAGAQTAQALSNAKTGEANMLTEAQGAA